MKESSSILLFIDEETTPIAHLEAPASFEIDTRKLVDGRHTLKVVSRDATGKEGIRLIPFEVRNGPSINIEGLKENAIVDGIVPVMVNAYSKGDTEKFYIAGSETPKSIPTWIWILLILFFGWGLFYLLRYFNITTN